MQEDLKKLLDGDMSAFDSFYNSTKKSIFYNIFSLLKDTSLSEDVLQETYLKFLENLPNLKQEKNIMGFLFVTSRNLALDVIKKRKREVNFTPLEYDRLTEEDNSNEHLDVIEKAKSLLKDKEFEIVILHIVNGLTHQEIAKLKHRPIGTITWAYNNAIKKLKKGWDK